jgi:chemotaxis protein MotB
VEEVAGGHHGGAWKVAYADFVTAMMAFFLLMWLINATSEQQRRGIAAYFSPMASVENGFSGAGLVPGGTSPLDKGTSLVLAGSGSPPVPNMPQANSVQTAAGQVVNDGDSSSGAANTDNDDDSQGPGTGAVLTQGSAPGTMQGQAAGKDGAGVSSHPAAADKAGLDAATNAAAASAEDASLKAAAGQARRLVAADPALADFAGQMAIDVTSEGMRIQIMDSESKPMFERGAASLNARAQALLRKVAPFLATLPEPLSVEGYSDGAPLSAGAVSNWTLSSGRANAARDLLVDAGLPDQRITNVTGFADRHLLLPADPLASANRRIVLTLRRQHGAPPPHAAGG